MTAVDTAISNREFLRALVTALFALAISAVLLIAGYLLAFPLLHPEFLPDEDGVAAYSLKGSEFTPVVAGKVVKADESSVVTALAEGRPDDQTILMRKVRLQADNYAFLRYHLEGRHPGLRIMLFWKTTDGGDTPFYSEVDNPGNGPQYHNLRRSGDWQGTITEITIGVFGDLREKTISLRELRLEAYSATGLLKTVWDEWTAFAPWDQTSINRYDGAPEGALIKLNGAASICLIIAMSMGWSVVALQPRLEANNWPYALPTNVIASICLAFLFLSGLWMHRLWMQNQETRYLFAGKNLQQQHQADWDGEYYALAQQIKAAMPLEAERLVILYTKPARETPFPARLRYHLLPDKRVEHLRQIGTGWVKRAARDYDFALIVGDPKGGSLDPLEELTAYGYKPTGREAILMNNAKAALIAWNRPGAHIGN